MIIRFNNKLGQIAERRLAEAAKSGDEATCEEAAAEAVE